MSKEEFDALIDCKLSIEALHAVGRTMIAVMLDGSMYHFSVV